MAEFLTLSKQDPRFFEYLKGTFSKNKRAIPLKSVNINTQSETITFEIVDIQEGHRPVLFERWLRAFRLERLLALLPIFFITLFNLNYFSISWVSLNSILALLGIIFIQISANLLNDYYDHIRGIDRISTSSGSRVLQRGWIRAIDLFNVGLIFLILGLLLGILIVKDRPGLLIIIGLIVALGVFEFSAGKTGLLKRGLGEIILFFFYGPLLSSGINLAVADAFLWMNFFAGSVLGMFILLVYHVNNLEKILVYNQTRYKNFVVYLGFDKSKKMLIIWIILLTLVFGLYSLQDQFSKLIPVAALIALASGILIRKIKELKSCIGSDLVELRRMTYFYYFGATYLWTIAMALY